MRTMFIRGTIGLCQACGGEVNVNHHVRGFATDGDHVHYAVAHSCGFRVDTVVPKSVHKSTVAWYRQVRDGMRDDGPAVSPEEELLVAFSKQLEQVETGDDIQKALDKRSGKGF